MSLNHSKVMALFAVVISVFCLAPSLSSADQAVVGEKEDLLIAKGSTRTRYGSEAKEGRTAASAKYYTLGDKDKKNYIPWTFPGINISSPPGFGASWGAVFIGGGYQNRARFTETGDGALGAGLGLGDAKEYVGVQVDVSILSLNNADRGGLTLKVHRVLPYNFGIAAGVENVTSWGGTDAPRSYYGSISRVFLLADDQEDVFSALTLTAGVGSGRFQSESNVNLGRDSVGIFGSAAIRVAEPLSFIADWTGQDLNLGLSITPLREWGLFINPSIADVTGNAGNGVRYLIGVGFAYIFV